jgi:hypothetical protein
MEHSHKQPAKLIWCILFERTRLDRFEKGLSFLFLLKQWRILWGGEPLPNNFRKPVTKLWRLFFDHESMVV